VELANRIAIVTGGTGALGRAVTLDLLAAGARAAVTHIEEKEWTALGASASGWGENLYGAKVDLTDSAAVGAFVNDVDTSWGRVDFLVAIAGGFAAGKSYEADDRTWDHMFNLNFRSLVNCVRAVVPRMVDQNFGRIVTISSGAILRGGGAGIAPYAISKGAVRQFSEILPDARHHGHRCQPPLHAQRRLLEVGQDRRCGPRHPLSPQRRRPRGPFRCRAGCGIIPSILGPRPGKRPRIAAPVALAFRRWRIRQ
jgi:NAD(P)-dependent dehydrogenase (short-subunit alcohol dehydrogenase family)